MTLQSLPENTEASNLIISGGNWMSVYTSRTRTIIRAAECLVQQVGRSDTASDELKPVTISKLVRNREAIFPVQIGKNTKLVHPNKTAVVPDNSPSFQPSHNSPQIRHHLKNLPR